ncbi:MAG: hypothetical protein WC525_04025 [Candidatus Thermoplasmatota archaeon]
MNEVGKKISVLLVMVCLVVVCIPVFVERATASGSRPFSEKADYTTNFNLQSNDNCTVTLNGWTETFVDGWDGTKAAYFNEGSTGTDKAIVKMKTPSGADIPDAKGAYFEFKVTNNYANIGAGSLCLLITNSYSSIYFGFYPGRYDVYIRYTDYANTPASKYLNVELQRQYLNSEYHRMFAHFNNATGVVTLGIDDKVYSISNIQRDFASSSVYLSLLTTGHPGIVLDNLKVFRDIDFPLEEYMQEYYPEFRIAYPENNYDFTYSPVIHADQMTYNMTKPIFEFFNSHGISVSQTYFFNYSTSQAYDSECLVDEPLRNYAISKQETNGIYTHSLKMNTHLNTAQVAAILAEWKQLTGSYPMLWVDHGALLQNVARYGSDVSSPYYIGNLRNASSLKYAWANYENLPRIPIPYGYYFSARNSLKGFLTGSDYGLVYNNQGAIDLFTSGKRIFLLDSTNVKYDYYTWELANKKALTLEHTYQQYYLYKNIDGIKYSKISYAGYSPWNSAWNLHYKDATSPWAFMPEYRTVMNSILGMFTVNSGLGHDLIDRGVLYNASSVYKTGNTIYVNTPSEMKNVTIYTRTNQSGKALERNGNYYPFTKGFYSWGATIPSNIGNNSYTLVNWDKYIGDIGQIGRIEFQANKNISIHFKRSESLTFELKEDTDPVSVINKTDGSSVDFNIIGRQITFQGGKDCEYLIVYGSGGTPQPPGQTYQLKTTARCRVISNGGVNVNISVYDDEGEFVGNYGASCDLWLDAGYTIDFGDFDATPLIRMHFEREE